jgi:DNA-binding GntR family transcriptional regulator
MARRAAKTVSDIYTILKKRVIAGVYPAEEPLSQLGIAEELGVSRTPLREAFRLLEKEGLVVSESNKRFRVASFSPSDLEELYVLRIAVESVAVRVSVQRFQSFDLERLTTILAAMDEAILTGSYEDWREPHNAFHRLLLVHSGGRLRELASQLSEHAERYRYAASLPTNPTSWSESHQDHHKLYEAAVAGDGERASHQLAFHYGRVALSVLSFSAPLHDPQMLRLTLSSFEPTVCGDPPR